MESYFEVILDYKPLSHVLVKAKDVIEAGIRAVEELSERGYIVTEESVIEIRRTNIMRIID